MTGDVAAILLIYFVLFILLWSLLETQIFACLASGLDDQVREPL